MEGIDMTLPKDPIILLSTVNTLLRDKYSNVEQLAEDYGVSAKDIKDKLGQVGYEYDEGLNQFK